MTFLKVIGVGPNISFPKWQAEATLPTRDVATTVYTHLGPYKRQYTHTVYNSKPQPLAS